MDARRKRMADLPFAEKLRILDKLREASREIASAGLRKTGVSGEPGIGSLGPKKPEPQPPAKPSKKS